MWRLNAVYLCIYLLPDFAADFACVTRKQCQEPLLINTVKSGV
jgi:hypothetical protein